MLFDFFSSMGNGTNNEKSCLKSYSCSTGGDMRGSHHSTKVSLFGEMALISIAISDAWYEDDKIREYSANNSILSEIENVYKKYNMKSWDRRKFTDMFVCDGASTSYSFDFGGGKYTSFSSQFYPKKYYEKLHEIDEIVKKYMESGTLLPGLVLPEKSEEEMCGRGHVNNGRIEIEVYSYEKNTLCYRVLNGKDSELKVRDTGRIARNSDGAEIISFSDEYEIHVYANSCSENRINLSERLLAGTYTLTVDELKCNFTIV